ncbi:MAG: PEP-CTERM sorting domain-containing protein [Candidatus Acidiferrum sp.]
MKKLLLFFSFLVFVAAGLPPAALADGDGEFTVTGTYSAGTMVTPLTAPGQSFTISFDLPTNPTSLMEDYVTGDDFYLNAIPASYTYNGSTITLNNALLSFYTSYSSSQSGGFFVDYCATDPTCMTGLDYQWTLDGPQQYTGGESDPTLVPSSFSYNGSPFWINYDANQVCATGISGTVTTNVVATPEPSALVLLLAGLGAFLVFVKVRG